MTKLRQLQIEAESRRRERNREAAIFWTIYSGVMLTLIVFIAYSCHIWRG